MGLYKSNKKAKVGETTKFSLPPDKMRVWIRGNKERGKEVIKALTDLGAKDKYNQGGGSESQLPTS